MDSLNLNMRAGACPVCRSTESAKARRATMVLDTEYSGTCARCEAATKHYGRATGEDVDADYAYHEWAHHTVLFRCAPSKRADYKSIQETIELFTMGRAQVHEMRVLALQYAAYKLLGWRPTVERLVSLSWPGIEQVDDTNYDCGGRMIIKTEWQACEGVRRLIPQVSKRNVALYRRVLLDARGET
jgi:hypothetical protein